MTSERVDTVGEMTGDDRWAEKSQRRGPISVHIPLPWREAVNADAGEERPLSFSVFKTLLPSRQLLSTTLG